MYTSTGKRTWDYNKEILNFGNVGGYICLRSIIVFALAGWLLMYVIIPIQIKVLGALGDKCFCILMSVIGLICLGDIIYNDILAVKLGTVDAITFYGKSGIYTYVSGYNI